MIGKFSRNLEMTDKLPEQTVNKEKFDPDKRLEPGLNTGEVKYPEKYDPDKRIEINESENILHDYFKDLKSNSEYPETISDRPFNFSDLELGKPEENSEKRQWFSDNKAQLKKEWEEVNGKSWPKYDADVYSESGKLIRKAGSDYDAHHIQPLSMGGENVASNITPLHADIHYDKQGIHAIDSAYSKLDKILRGMN